VRPILALAAAGVLAFGGAALGCGGDDEEKDKKGRDLTALPCPVSTGKDGNSFDTAELIGKRLKEARAKAAEHDCSVVVSIEDGKSMPVPVDVDPKRITVYTKGGVVTEIESVGGGL
jgi:hypothetical protein